MQTKLQQEIESLKEQLRKERENMSGNAQQMQQKMQAEIDELKRQLQERTGQLETASVTILERNDELAKLRDQINDLNKYHEESVAKFEERIR